MTQGSARLATKVIKGQVLGDLADEWVVIDAPSGACVTTALKRRLAESASTIDDLADFRTQALAQLAAQYDEIARFRRLTDHSGRVRRLPSRPSVIESCN
ncbi:MAG TPA: hypothetical protein VGM75_03585 [Pseudonocardiaceae bacterium]